MFDKPTAASHILNRFCEMNESTFNTGGLRLVNFSYESLISVYGQCTEIIFSKLIKNYC